MSFSDGRIKINMWLHPKDALRLDRFTAAIDARTRSAAIRRAIELADSVTRIQEANPAATVELRVELASGGAVRVPLQAVAFTHGRR